MGNGFFRETVNGKWETCFFGKQESNILMYQYAFHLVILVFSFSFI